MGESGNHARPPRVMQSFGPPRPTSNPYIHMLDEELARTPELEHLRFDRTRALVGRYDALHFHWPETMFGGSTRVRAWARTAYATALVARLRLSRIAVIRTVHNLELPQDVSAWQRRLLESIEARADHRIVLNDRHRPQGDPHTLIPHGHYRDWFADAPRERPAPDTIGFVGLIRRYKGVEDLLDAFEGTRAAAPEFRLVITGNPTGSEIATEVGRRASRDDRVSVRFGYLSEADFARATTSASGIVLPYRFMHNSGTVLAALSLDRPVLVPRTTVNEALAREVGSGWVHMYEGSIGPEDLLRFREAIAAPAAAAPDLSARAWTSAGAAHAAAYREAIRRRRGRA